MFSNHPPKTRTHCVSTFFVIYRVSMKFGNISCAIRLRHLLYLTLKPTYNLYLYWEYEYLSFFFFFFFLTKEIDDVTSVLSSQNIQRWKFEDWFHIEMVKMTNWQFFLHILFIIVGYRYKTAYFKWLFVKYPIVLYKFSTFFTLMEFMLYLSVFWRFR